MVATFKPQTKSEFEFGWWYTQGRTESENDDADRECREKEEAERCQVKEIYQESPEHERD